MRFPTKDICQPVARLAGSGFPGSLPPSSPASTCIQEDSGLESIRISLHVIVGIIFFSELKREMRQARLALMPLLLAEQDRIELFRRTRMLDLEARAMKDVPGWVLGESPYKSGSEAARSARPAVLI